ncbi:MAG: peptidase domain-containing ABC transporter [Pseudomonadota bacterium]
MIWERQLQFGFRRRLPVILQSEAAECGLACLAMILAFHGHPIDLTLLRRRYAISLKGTTLRHLMEIASATGLAVRALRLEIPDLSRLRLPCVLHWDLNHFVVLEKIDPKAAVIHDPAAGRRTVPLADLSKSFTGIALEVLPSDTFVKADERQSMRLWDLFRKVSGLRSSLGQILLLSLGIEATTLLIPIASQVIIDEVIVNADRDLLLVVAVGLGLLLLSQLAIATARTWAIMLTSTRISLRWNSSLFDHLARLPLNYFENRHVGDLISRFSALTVIQKALTTDLVQAVLDGIMAIGMLIMLFVYGGWLGFVAIASVSLNVALRVVAYSSYRERTEDAIINEAKQQSHFIETMRGIATVKLLGLAERRRGIWINYFIDSLNARLQLQRLDLVFSRANDFLFGADRVILLMLGATMVLDSKMTLGMLVAFLAYKDQFTGRVGNLLTSGLQLRALNVQTDRLSDIALAEPEPQKTASFPPNALGFRYKGATLIASGVSLRYGDNEPWIFRNVTLAIEAGQCCAITGPSGCGKTTFLKILMGLLEPTEGAVTIDNVDVRSLSTDDYRRYIGGVLQNDGLFAGTIAENISGFDDQPDYALIEECAMRSAIIDDIRRMPMAFETLVGDMGSALSGGQKQRIILARALYLRPRILFLDEATSHLDEATEAIIAETLRALKITRVIAAHRPATLAHADVVIPFGQWTRASRTLRRSAI